MPPLKQAPDGVRAFLFHGVQLDNLEREQASGECPFCGGSKFYANTMTGLWDCKPCAIKGNPQQFVEMLYTASAEQQPDVKGLEKLREDRGLLSRSTLLRWGVCRSLLTGDWLVPGFDEAGKIVTVYRYASPKPGSKAVLLASPGTPTGVFRSSYFDPKGATELRVNEGPWDAMAHEEVLIETKKVGPTKFALTGNWLNSQLKGVNVIGVPGAGQWKDRWGVMAEGRVVCLLYDNDHPKTNPQTGTASQAGYDGARRTVGLLKAHDPKPTEVRYLDWGPDGYDPELPSGYDVRDAVAGAGTAVGRAVLLDKLLGRVKPTPAEWVGKSAKPGGTTLQPLPCTDWRKVVACWRGAMKWTDGLHRALSCMLATAASTEVPGDQLWMKIVGPASCGKSTLCEALAVAVKHVKSISTLRGFHSGYQMDKGGSKDMSLIAQITGKTLVLKDGDTLLQAPNLTQILAEARDVYDRVSRTSYRNEMSKEYDGVHMTWLLCGTSSLRALDTSELGQRFLDCVIMDDISDALEHEVNLRKLHASVGLVYSGAAGGRDGESPDMVQAKRITAGYLIHLRENSARLRRGLTPPSEDTLVYLSRLARYVAFMRARPSKSQDEEVTREMSTRLACQLFLLGTMLCVVTGEDCLDRPRVLEQVRRVALDTARGRTTAMMEHLCTHAEDGLDATGVGLMVGEASARVKELIRFLRGIKALRAFHPPGKDGKPSRAVRYRPTDGMSEAYRVAHTPLVDVTV